MSYLKKLLKKLSQNITYIVTFICFFLILANIDIEKFFDQYNWYITMKANLAFITEVIIKILPVAGVIIFLFILIMFKKKWVIRIEKLSIGGATVEFDRPESFFFQNVKNLLNTKRTLFKFDEERDNIYDTISSFYNVYSFIREQLKIYDPKSSEDNECYKKANCMIYLLNEFLTSHQDNFRRWYDHEKTKSDNYNVDICELQKNYRNYSKLIRDITELNEEFRDYGVFFKVDINKWDNPKFKNII